MGVEDDNGCSTKYGELYVEDDQKYESMEDQNIDRDVGGRVQCSCSMRVCARCMQTTQNQGK